MTAKEFLNRYQDAMHDERRIQTQIDELKERAVSLRSPDYGSHVQDGKQAEGKLLLIDEAVDLEMDELRPALERLQQTRRQVAQTIKAVPNGRYRELLTHRYICCKGWEWIAQRMGYNRDYLARELHQAALSAVRVPETTNGNGNRSPEYEASRPTLITYPHKSGLCVELFCETVGARPVYSIAVSDNGYVAG